MANDIKDKQADKPRDTTKGGIPRDIPAGAPVVPEEILNRSHQRLLTVDEQESLASELEPGDLAYVKLSETGEPTGPALLDAPTDGTPVARVAYIAPPESNVLTTPTGAPITNQMNPVTDLYDPALIARNPIPEYAEEKEDLDLSEYYKKRDAKRAEARKKADDAVNAKLKKAQELRETKRKEIDDKYDQRRSEQDKARAENRQEPK